MFFFRECRQTAPGDFRSGAAPSGGRATVSCRKSHAEGLCSCKNQGSFFDRPHCKDYDMLGLYWRPDFRKPCVSYLWRPGPSSKDEAVLGHRGGVVLLCMEMRSNGKQSTMRRYARNRQNGHEILNGCAPAL